MGGSDLNQIKTLKRDWALPEERHAPGLGAATATLAALAEGRPLEAEALFPPTVRKCVLLATLLSLEENPELQVRI